MNRRLIGGAGLVLLGVLATHCSSQVSTEPANSSGAGGGGQSGTAGSGPATGGAGGHPVVGASGDAGQGAGGHATGGTAGSSNIVGGGGTTAGAGGMTAGAGGMTAGAGGMTAGAGGMTAGAGGTTSVAGAGGASAGSGGKGGAGGSGGSAGTGPSVCDGTASRLLTNTLADAFIDDFEKENLNPVSSMLDPAQPAPAWYGFNDITVPNSVQLVRTAGGATSTAFGGHYAGTGAKTPSAGGYGVGLDFNVGVDRAIGQYCVDASAFDGVSFWAKVGSATNAMISMGFVVPSQNQVMNGGDCPDSMPAKCNNYPLRNLTLTTDWTQYTVDFAAVTGSTGAKVVGGKIQQLLWLAPTTNWDISLDELSFYHGVPPTGAVGVH